MYLKLGRRSQVLLSSISASQTALRGTGTHPLWAWIRHILLSGFQSAAWKQAMQAGWCILWVKCHGQDLLSPASLELHNFWDEGGWVAGELVRKFPANTKKIILHVYRVFSFSKRLWIDNKRVNLHNYRKHLSELIVYIWAVHGFCGTNPVPVT